jgi:hypothetical protein
MAGAGPMNPRVAPFQVVTEMNSTTPPNETTPTLSNTLAVGVGQVAPLPDIVPLNCRHPHPLTVTICIWGVDMPAGEPGPRAKLPMTKGFVGKAHRSGSPVSPQLMLRQDSNSVILVRARPRETPGKLVSARLCTPILPVVPNLRGCASDLRWTQDSIPRSSPELGMIPSPEEWVCLRPTEPWRS